MTSVYIHSAVSISAQNTFESDAWISQLTSNSDKKAKAIHPDYKDYISSLALRRMATGVKMGVTAATKALKNAEISEPDAILTGTGMGCIEDTEKFLNNIIANDEEFLTPTAFIQSTHNTVGAQIALGLNCKMYNNTYVHGALSFESALMDAQLLIQQSEAKNVLVGGIDELGAEFVDSVRMLEDQNSHGIKVPIGEGATFFVMSSEAKENAIELLDIQSFSQLKKEEVAKTLNDFLMENNLNHSDIDALVLGNNGDGFDDFYGTLSSEFSPHITSITYKKYIGEYFTASAFALFWGFKILSSQHIPEVLLQHKISKSSIKTILLYNQFKGRDHSFILLKSC
ncbi:MAG: beta-ketoacyl synthase chain length factor [Gelidibacter sp.]